jgi:hypothetical protein
MGINITEFGPNKHPAMVVAVPGLSTLQFSGSPILISASPTHHSLFPPAVRYLPSVSFIIVFFPIFHQDLASIMFLELAYLLLGL